MADIIHLNSIADIHRMLGIANPTHPLVTVIDNDCIGMANSSISYSTGMFIISMKSGMTGSMKYGASTYDFNDGVMLFMAPEQVIIPAHSVVETGSRGWTLMFHPDLIRRTSLGQKINQYTFFAYDVNEALHLSDSEMQTLTELSLKIVRELEQNIDKHTENLISGSIELMLDYCIRYYDRQFYTRSNKSKDTIIDFENLLRNYFDDRKVIEALPSVAYCGKALGISPNYLSDLLKKETGKTTKEHIQLFVIELAKNKLLGSELSISQIAYQLGFDYPAHFSKLFKNATGQSPSDFRKLN